MRLLLDTHIALWAWREPAKLPSTVRSILERSTDEILVSAATAREIAIKTALGKIEYRLERFGVMMEAMGFLPLPITIPHALAAGALPRHHADPFDRMLIAQAQCEGLVLVTADRNLARYDVPILAAR